MSRASERIILGIDPGTLFMGYGLLHIIHNKPQVITLGVITLSKYESHYLRLARIFSRISGLIEEFTPDEMALEAPFYGKNVQSMLKLGRAQGVAMAAALSRDIPIAEYTPTQVKQSITGVGSASKEQVATILAKTLSLPQEPAGKAFDATDALAIALCHFYRSSNPLSGSDAKISSWEEFVKANPGKIKGL